MLAQVTLLLELTFKMILLKKQIGFCEIDYRDNPTLFSINMNPKEYFQKYRDKNVSKQNKGGKIVTLKMYFDVFLGRILLLRYYTTFKPRKFESLLYKINTC